MTRKRIEPSLTGNINQTDESVTHQESSYHHRSAAPVSTTTLIIEKVKVGCQLAYQFCKNKGLITPKNIGIVIGLFVLVIVSLIFFSGSNTNQAEQEIAEQHAEAVNAVNRNRSQQVDFQDNFSLFITDYQGIVIHWQADVTITSEVWHAYTASGEQNCQALTFNTGERFTTLEVIAENGENYFAYFSPTDSEKIVKAIAKRSNFKLCGFSFSLKGSQSTLSNHRYYSEILLN